MASLSTDSDLILARTMSGVLPCHRSPTQLSEPSAHRASEPSGLSSALFNPMKSPRSPKKAASPRARLPAPIWFPAEHDLWVPADNQTLTQYLLKRIADSSNYTAFAGYDTLVSVNPNQTIPEVKEAAQDTFTQLWKKVHADPRSIQSVLVVGDSGSGKTVAFNAFLSAAEASPTFREWHNHAHTLLQAFGCASMARNANSSRFVNVLRLELDSKHALVRGCFLPTLLEKSRITQRNAGEGNFHLLRYLPSLLTAAERAELYLDEPVAEAEGSPLLLEGSAFWAALEYMGLGRGSVEGGELLRLVAAIHALQALTFVSGSGNTDPALVKSGSLEQCAELLGVTTANLQLCLCQRRIMAGGHRSIHEANLTVPLAEMCRDVLCKEVYEATFAWIVEHMNRRAPSDGGDVVKTLYAVDAFGFENLSAADNKVEQLLANHINDLVYGRYYRREVLLREEEAYHSEGMTWEFASQRIPDSELSLDLVGRRNTGLLALLDEQSRLGAIGSDAGYLCETRGIWGKTGHACYSKPRFDEDSGYVVKHFVAPVTYTVLDFVDRNSEGVHKTYSNLRGLLETSTLAAVLRPALDLPDTKRLGDRNMGERVMHQTQALQAILDESERIHFILCLRSSPSPQDTKLDAALIDRQVQNFKINEATEARRLPVHVTFGDFGHAFEDVFRALGVSMQYSPSVCMYVLDKALPTSKWALGHSQIFLSADARRILFSKEHSIELDVATRIQSYYRMWKAWRTYRQQRAASRIGALWRGHSARRGVQKQVAAIVNLQSALRMYRARVQYAQTRKEYTEASTKIEAQFRVLLAKRERARRLAAVVKIQATWRRYIAVKTFEEICLGRMHVNSLAASPFLHPGEAVVLAGVVLKKPQGLSVHQWHRRILVLTTQPRLLYVDPSKNELRGEIAYTMADHAVLLNDTDFELITPKRTFKFRTLMKPNAALWCHVLQNPSTSPNFLLLAAMQKEAMGASKRLSITKRQSVKANEQLANAKQVRSRTMLRKVAWNEGRDIKVGKLMQMQGYMMKFEEGFFGKWSRRYFLIQENKLSWFARSVDTEPLGALLLSGSVIMRDTEVSKKFSFTVEGSSPQGQKVLLRLQAFTAEQKKAWIDEIAAITKTQPFPYTF